MRLLAVFVLLGGVLGFLLVVAPTVDATHVCGSSGVCDGHASAIASPTATGSRRFCLQEVSVNNGCSVSDFDQTGLWEVPAGGSLTLEYFSGTQGTVPPAAPTTLQLLVRIDTTTTNFCAFQMTGTEPAQGTTYTFHARTGCTAGGTPVAGTFRIYIRALKTGGLDAYDVTSDGNGPTGQGAFRKGSLRSQIVVSNLDDTGPPSGSTYAYGTASDETITGSATFTAQAYDLNNEQMRLDLITSAGGTVETGTVSDQDTTTRQHSYVVDETLTASSSTYALRLVLAGNAALTGDPWTVYATTGHFSGFIRDSDTVLRTPATLTADPRIHVESRSCDHVLYNRGETPSCTVDVENARDEDVTRSVTITVKDSLGATKDTEATTGNPHASGLTIGASDDAAFDFTGKQWILTADTADTYESAPVNAYRVSSKYMVGSSAGSNDLTVTNTDGYSVVNRGEQKTWSVYLSFARGDALASTSNINEFVRRDADSSNDLGQTVTTDAAGLVASSYTPAATDPATADVTGDAKVLFYAFAGNTADETVTAWGVSSLYFVDVHPQKDEVLVKDDFPAQDATEDHAYIISSDVLRAWTHVEGVRLDGTEIDTTGTAISVILWDPTGDAAQSHTTDTGSDGWANGFGFTPNAPAGTWHLSGTVSYLGNTGFDNETLDFVSAFTANLVLRLHFPPTVEPNTTVAIYVRTEVDDVATEPDGVPVMKISRVNTSTTPPSWEDVVSIVSMLNVVDWTASVDGALYQYNFTVPGPGTYNVWARAPLQSAPIRETNNLLQVQEGLAMPTDLNVTTDIAPMLEYLFWLTVFLAALVWGGYIGHYWVMTGAFVGILSLFTPLGDWDTESIFILTLVAAFISALSLFWKKRRVRNRDPNMTEIK